MSFGRKDQRPCMSRVMEAQAPLSLWLVLVRIRAICLVVTTRKDMRDFTRNVLTAMEKSIKTVS